MHDRESARADRVPEFARAATDPGRHEPARIELARTGAGRTDAPRIDGPGAGPLPAAAQAADPAERAAVAATPLPAGDGAPQNGNPAALAPAAAQFPAAAHEGGASARSLDVLWRELQHAIRARVEPAQFATWFQRAVLVHADEEVLRFGVQNEFSREWLDRYYAEPLALAARETFGSARRIDIIVIPELAIANPRRTAEEAQRNAEATARGVDSGEQAAGGVERSIDPARNPYEIPRPAAAGARPARAKDASAPAVGAQDVRGQDVRGDVRGHETHAHAQQDALRGLGLAAELGLNPKYTFDNFVVGPCNRFAHAAAMGAAEQPGKAYNPFFLHGSVGLGKTHLLQSMCFAILARNPRARILYLSCETFVNHFISALENGDIQEFRNKYRSVDVLVVDDIQVLANKERTQEEFFHTFNTLHQQGKQIVLSSDGPPKDIPTLQERLVSRFKWGLVTEMEPPCYETRMAILKRKSRERGHELPDDVAALLAERIDSNIRELEGAVIRLLGFSNVSGAALSCEFARDVLRDVFTTRRPQPAMSDILTLVTAHYDVKLSELQSKRRTAAIVLPRQVAMFLARRITRHSLEEIGTYFGGRDHSTVLYGIEKIQTLMASDVSVRELVDDFLLRLQPRSG